MENALVDHPVVVQPDAAPRRPAAPERVPTPRKVDLRWIAMICLLLGASGAFRYWRDFQFASLESQSKGCPFPLKEIPGVLGSWRQVDGVEAALDPEIARLAGSTDHILRSYENTTTGEKATVLVIYGLALNVWGHTPDICYTNTGYKSLSAGREVMIPVKDAATPVPFREGLYGMFQGGAASYHDVFHSFRNAGEWRPNMESRWKQFRYNPGMFKIQVERLIKDPAKIDDSCQDLLAALVASIESRIRESGPAVAAAK
ncbi:exosortase-associated EpsI family protein [Paludisphaera mucosa]|uniref:Exosortase-associated EpsI family protein n=1 Tax=Paludisphaera mucosa TaxID=3030827 RepID=A0ABT6FKM9_9BACT|nr:exosortase-associated EpsI family protein [Paludisphaera mucosa]MDG3008138.1 exosortase-associated EpsI family protein [Paludisphaera mucosa]